MDNDAFRWAAHLGQIEIVQILVQDPRVNPASDDNYALAISCEMEHDDIIDILVALDAVRNDTSFLACVDRFEVLREMGFKGTMRDSSDKSATIIRVEPSISVASRASVKKKVDERRLMSKISTIFKSFGLWSRVCK